MNCEGLYRFLGLPDLNMSDSKRTRSLGLEAYPSQRLLRFQNTARSLEELQMEGMDQATSQRTHGIERQEERAEQAPQADLGHLPLTYYVSLLTSLYTLYMVTFELLDMHLRASKSL